MVLIVNISLCVNYEVHNVFKMPSIFLFFSSPHRVLGRMYENTTQLTTLNLSRQTPTILTDATGGAVIALDGLISIFGTLGNLLVLAVIFVALRFSTVSNILIANLACVDLLTVTVLIPGDIARHLCARMGLCHADRTLVLLHRVLAQFIVTAASTSLFFIALERFIAIAFPFRYKSLFTKTKATVCSFLTWTSGAIITGIFHGLNIIYVQNTYCILLLLVTFILYFYMFFVALKHEKKIASTPANYNMRPTQLLWESKSAKTMAIVLGVYALCWFPSVIFYSVVRQTDWLYPRLQVWINTVYYSNATLDPLIYSVRSEKFRRSVNKLLTS